MKWPETPGCKGSSYTKSHFVWDLQHVYQLLHTQISYYTRQWEGTLALRIQTLFSSLSGGHARKQKHLQKSVTSHRVANPLYKTKQDNDGKWVARGMEAWGCRSSGACFDQWIYFYSLICDLLWGKRDNVKHGSPDAGCTFQTALHRVTAEGSVFLCPMP